MGYETEIINKMDCGCYTVKSEHDFFNCSRSETIYCAEHYQTNNDYINKLNNEYYDNIKKENEKIPKKKIKDMTKEEKAAYDRECNRKYREKNRDKINDICKNYYYKTIQPNPEKMKKISEQKKQYYKDNKEKKDAYSKKYNQNLLLCKKRVQELESLLMLQNENKNI